MKQKYEIIRNNDKNQLIIREYVEANGEEMSLFCEETYDLEYIYLALNKNRDFLIKAIRTCNIYPPSVYVTRIVEMIENILSSTTENFSEIIFDEKEISTEEKVLNKDAEKDKNSSDSKSIDLDVLLQDDLKVKDVDKAENKK